MSGAIMALPCPLPGSFSAFHAISKALAIDKIGGGFGAAAGAAGARRYA